ncbi:hypothetical protein B0H17DRAFT_1129870 [Mycena rosella]|uniref:Uncharacterized protein n=1 Tax=Mycena rosella TaxID=1033263 RepID=A0AAD7GJZ9_MYCRO|nr:hypothetical protein B0H17DRAFT_1129870 [Mycena rosella]
MLRIIPNGKDPIVDLYMSATVRDSRGTVASQFVLDPHESRYVFLSGSEVLGSGGYLRNASSDDTTITGVDARLSAFNLSSVSIIGSGILTTFQWAYSLPTSVLSTDVSNSSFCQPPGLGLYAPANGTTANKSFSIEPPPCTYQTQTQRMRIQPPAMDSIWWESIALEELATPDKRNGANFSVSNVMLHDLENTLEDYTAAFFWSLAYLRNSPTNGTVEVVGPKLVSQLQLDILPLIAGAILSVSLLVLSPVLVGSGPAGETQREQTEMYTLSVLEILWLAEAGDLIADVENPSTRSLRQAVEKRVLRQRHSSAAMLVGHEIEGSINSLWEEDKG